MAYRTDHIQGKALYFKGNDDWLQRTDSGAGIANLDPEPDEAFSFFCWIKCLEYSATNKGTIMSKQTTAGTSHKAIGFGRYNSLTDLGRSWTSTLGVTLVSNKGTSPIALSCSAGNNAETVLRKMGWSHAGFTYDGTGTTAGLKLYINAVDVTTQSVLNGGSTADFIDTAGGAEFATGETLYVATDNYSNERESMMCQVGMYNAALTATQVREVYQGRNDLPGPCDLTLLSTSANLVGYWLGDDGSDTYATLQDRSGNNFDLTSSGVADGMLAPCKVV